MRTPGRGTDAAKLEFAPQLGLGPDRDLVGYGRRIPRVMWPDHARVAMNLVVRYEEGSEYSHAAGDDHGEPVGEFSAAINSALAGNAISCIESVFAYGSRAGVWRLARIVDLCDVKSTVFASAVELNPGVGLYMCETRHPKRVGWTGRARALHRICTRQGLSQCRNRMPLHASSN